MFSDQNHRIAHTMQIKLKMMPIKGGIPKDCDEKADDFWGALILGQKMQHHFVFVFADTWLIGDVQEYYKEDYLASE